MQELKNMQRTPPSAIYSSQPNLHTESEDHETIKNINTRKRKNPDAVELNDLKESIKTMFKDLFAIEISQIKQQNAQIMQSNTEILELLQTNAENFKQLNDKMHTIETKYSKTLDRIDELESQLNNLEKHQNKNIVEVRNVPQQEKENLQSMLALLYENLKLSNMPNVVQCYRKGKHNAPIVLKFRNFEDKEMLLKATKSYNKINSNQKLSSSHLGLSGNTKPVYISEPLTSINKKILMTARNLVKDGHFKYCWTSRGNILIRKADGEPAMVIKTCAQIETFRST